MPPQPNSPSSVCGARTSARCQLLDHAGTASLALLPAARVERDEADAAARSSDPRRSRCRRASGTRIAASASPRRARRRRRRRSSRRNAGSEQRDERARRTAPRPTSAGLRRDGHRRVVRGRRLRVLPLQVHPLSVRVLEAAHADTAHRMGLGDADPVRDEARPAARRAVQPGPSCGAAIECRICGCATAIPATTTAASADRDERPPAPGDRRHADDRHEQRREARLRERDEQAEPRDDAITAADASCSAHRARPRTSSTTRRHHRDDEEAPVHGRIPEHGVDAEERRVRVRVDHLRVLEHVAGLVLVEADGREDERHRRQLGVEGARAEPAPRQARDARARARVNGT